jgi:inhibitor of cysteine peptidase
MRLIAAGIVSSVALALAIAPLACASDKSDEPISSPNEEGSADDELRSLALQENDNGKTVTVTEGQSVVVKLPANPTTGFKWVVAATDRTFGQPATSQFVRNGDAVGSGGLEKLTWKTRASLGMIGTHTVKLEYKRESAAAQKTFTFTVKIVSGVCPMLSPPAPGFCNNGQIKAKKDPASGCTTGYECAADCRANPCGSGRSCSFCWGNFACIPNGAMC